MDHNFSCEKCGQELAGDDTMIGMEIECPSCNQVILVPGPTETVGISDIGTGAPEPAYEERTPLRVPVGSGASADLIKKPTARPLNVAAKEEIKILSKTILYSQNGKDAAKFDEAVGKALSEIGKLHLIATHPVNTSDDFGIVIVYDKV